MHPIEPIPMGIANGRCGATPAASRRLEHGQLCAESRPSRHRQVLKSHFKRRNAGLKDIDNRCPLREHWFGRQGENGKWR